MKKLDLGLREYPLGAGVLRLNPTDPALYSRFEKAAQEMSAVFQAAEEDLPGALQTADGKIKKLLNSVFPGNDFDSLLGGVSLFAIGKNGRTVLQNLLSALMPILTAGAESCIRSLTRQALEARKR